jgi:subtilase family serine protease
MTGTVTRQLLERHVPQVAKGLKPLRAVPEESELDLILGLSLRQQERLTQLISDLSNPTSSRFRQFLKPPEFTLLFSPTEADYAKLIAFAEAHAFEVLTRVPNRTLLHVRASAGAIGKAFHLTLHTYQHPESKREFFAPDREPSVDADFSLLHITGLDNVALLKAIPLDVGWVPIPSLGSGTGGAFSAVDLRAAYAPGVSLTGAGQVIGILSFGSYNQSDIDLYAIKNGMSPVPIQNVDLAGFNAPDPNVDNLPNTEATLDIEMAIAMAPGLSKVVVYRAPYSSIPTLLNEMANPTKGEPFPNQLSTSYAINYGNNSSNEQIFKQMAAQGQSFFVASGDNGAYFPVSRAGDFPPADSEYVTCVGGTVLSTTGPGGAWQSEVAWPSSGGGYGWFPLPQWQQQAVNQTNMASTTLRNCPDVAMVSSNVEIIRLGQARSVDGTSASSPLWASFTALVNEQAAANGLPPVGFLNPALYAIGRSAEYTETFHDIASGNNSSAQASFNSVAGYDLVTGWGSPTGLPLINALALRTPLHPPLTAANIRLLRTYPCDPGPIAGTLATFVASVTGGAAPFSYQWASDAPVASGGQPSSSLITVSVPTAGQTITLTVTIKDSAGNTVNKSVTVTAMDPSFAARLSAICQLLQKLHEFRWPIYINPGDPGPVSDPERLSQLQRLQEIASNLAASIGELRRRAID